MSNLKNLTTNHYQSKILKIKKLKFNNNIYIGFNINDLQNIKEFKDNLKNKIKNKKTKTIIEFNLKGLTYINIKNLKSTLNNF
tara:strand:+ start:1309 stop:1557 length:249 start_codon:yes stop_codon:yes gene_type:complete